MLCPNTKMTIDMSSTFDSQIALAQEQRLNHFPTQSMYYTRASFDPIMACTKQYRLINVH